MQTHLKKTNPYAKTKSIFAADPACRYNPTIRWTFAQNET